MNKKDEINYELTPNKVYSVGGFQIVYDDNGKKIKVKKVNDDIIRFIHPIVDNTIEIVE